MRVRQCTALGHRPAGAAYGHGVTLTFAQHVDLLALHGRAAADGLARRDPDDLLSPQHEQAAEVALEHWTTLEIWAWSLDHPNSHWSARTDPEEPASHEEVVAGIGALTGALTASLRAGGPDVVVDYFERPGRTSDVARLLAHEAIVVAHKAGSGPRLSAEVAHDGIDHTLSHWSNSTVGAAAGVAGIDGAPGADGMPATTWQSDVLAIRATDRDATWLISLPEDAELRIGDFRVVSWPGDRSGRGQEPSAMVQGPEVDLLWWLQGDPIPEAVVSVTGRDADVRALNHTFLQPVPEPPRQWFGLRSGK